MSQEMIKKKTLKQFFIPIYMEDPMFVSANNIHEKVSDWLRAVQFLVNTVPKKEIQCQKRKFSANSLDFKFLNFLTTHMYIYSMRMFL